MERVTDKLTVIAYAYNKSPIALFVAGGLAGTRVWCCKSLQNDRELHMMWASAVAFSFYESPQQYINANFKPKSKASKLRCVGCYKKLREHK